MKKYKLVAEIGCNHQGNLFLAKKMIETAVQYGRADYIKFQKREVHELLSEKEYLSPHPNPKQSFGHTYGAHRENLEFSIDQHRELKEHCERLGTRYACSVWDKTSARNIISIQPDYLKVPSASNLDFELLETICTEYSGQIHVSLGMTTKLEALRITDFLKNKNALGRTVLYSCVSAYPVPAEQVCLYDLQYLRDSFASDSIGFSGHHEGILLDIAALSLGATWIERHFTLDKTWKGTDQSLSLDPREIQELRKNLNLVASALHFKSDELLPIELAQREKLKRKISRSDLYV